MVLPSTVSRQLILCVVCRVQGADDLLVKVWSLRDGRLLCTLRGAGAEITDVCLTRDGALLAAGSVDRLVRVWSLAGGEPRAQLHAHAGTITSVHWSGWARGDVRWLASTSTDGSVAFWACAAGGQFLSQPVQYMERMRPGACHMICAAWSAGGAFLAAGSQDHHVRVYMVDSEGGPARVLETAVHSEAVDSLAWAHRGLRFVSGSKDGAAAVWTLHAAAWRHELLHCHPLTDDPSAKDDGKKLKVTMVCWDLSDAYVITAVSDCTIRVWCSRTCSLVRVLRGHRDEAYVLEAHPLLPGVLLSAGHDGQLFVWDAPTGETDVLGRPAAARSAALRGTRRTAVRVGRAHGGGEATHRRTCWGDPLLPGVLLSAGHDGQLFVWDAPTGEVRPHTDGRAGATRCCPECCSPRDTTDSCSCGTRPRGGEATHRRTCWGDPLLPGVLLSAGHDGQLFVWDAPTGETDVLGRPAAARSAALRGTRRTAVRVGRAHGGGEATHRRTCWGDPLLPGVLLSAGHDGQLFVWDAPTGEVRPHTDGRAGATRCCPECCSPRDTTDSCSCGTRPRGGEAAHRLTCWGDPLLPGVLLSAGHDGQLFVWDAPTGETDVLGRPAAAQSAALRGTRRTAVRVGRAHGGGEATHRRTCWGDPLLPGVLLSAGHDGQLFVWDAPTGETDVLGRPAAARSAALRGTRRVAVRVGRAHGGGEAAHRLTCWGDPLLPGVLLSAGHDGQLFVWDAPTGETDVLGRPAAARSAALRGTRRTAVRVGRAHGGGEATHRLTCWGDPLLPGVLLSAGHDGQLFVWDAPTGEVLASFLNRIEGQGEGAIFDAKWGGAGQLAACDAHGHLLLLGLAAGAPLMARLPTELFFHTDYRPLLRDAQGQALDEQTEIPPHLMPPPFLVDVEGAPHPPEFQRLVPGRENLALSQLVPAADAARNRIDIMIEVGARCGNGNTGFSGGAHAGAGERPGAGGGAGGGVWRGEGVRHTAGRWQLAHVPPCTRPLVPPAPPAARAAADRQGAEMNAFELAWWRREMRRRPIMISTAPEPGRRRARARAQAKARARAPPVPVPVRRAVEEPPAPAADSSPSDTSDESVRLSRSPSRSPSRSHSRTSRSRSRSHSHSHSHSRSSRTTMDLSDSSTRTGRTEPRWRPPRARAAAPSPPGGTYRERERERERERSVSWSRLGERSRAGAPRARAPPPRRRQEMTLFTGPDDTDMEIPILFFTYTPIEAHIQSEHVCAEARGGGCGGGGRGAAGGELPELYRPGEWLTAVSPRKAPYHPQMGDECLYFRLGHQRYLEAVAEKDLYPVTARDRPWETHQVYECELVKVVGIKYAIKPPRVACVRLACSLPRARPGGTSGAGAGIVVVYHDMPDVIDFLVLRQQYNAACARGWASGDRPRPIRPIDKSRTTAWALRPKPSCQQRTNTGWDDDDARGRGARGARGRAALGRGGRGALGGGAAARFLSLKVRWDNGEVERLSPWDLEPPDPERNPSALGGAVPVLPHELEAVLYKAEPHEWPPRGDRAAACRAIAHHLNQVRDDDHDVSSDDDDSCGDNDDDGCGNVYDNDDYDDDGDGDVTYQAAVQIKCNAEESDFTRVSVVLVGLMLRHRELMVIIELMMMLIVKSQIQTMAKRVRPPRQVMSLSAAEPFVAPVDLQLYPTYALVVPYPIDLSTIRARCDHLFYRRAAAAQFDARYLASNAERFNEPRAPIVRQARLVTDLLLYIIR
ncbi:hypothetical protein MSG28_014402 [Choristoneura fumiferana]|uniref:Uncharacterized protein n=1 Tax=Choristoneura fumiferana TaxID=7141 RepID=A0ACC0JRC0_CHOFU|nr:hypothetical protein MSG28_014402 [Choristoneura fumiferana]